METSLTLTDIAGYATERMIWQLMQSLSASWKQGMLDHIMPCDVIVGGDGVTLKRHKATGKENNHVFCAPEAFSSQSDSVSDCSEVWTLGALAFFALTGTHVFEGKGGQTQTQETEIPRVSSAYASQALSSLIIRCLSYLPSDRPTMDDISRLAQEALSKPVVLRQRLVSQTGKRYVSSLVRFWPEEMVPVLLLFVLLCFPNSGWGQSAFDIPNEMANLVLRCVDLRSPMNADRVSKAMERDMKWTMMDELAIDRKGECTTKDIVDTFGLNDIGFRILKRHGGVTNAGGRFRDGRDPRYKYSFIEITVKKGNAVSYEISGREGEQIFAIVPFDQDAAFEATIPNGKTIMKDGICYIQLKQRLIKEQKFTLTITNKSGKNAAFALINYNSRNHE